MELDAVSVVAALIRRGDRFLICRRPREKVRGLLWEFAGGRVEPGETPEEALRRECREELELSVTPLSVYAELTYPYPDMKVHLTLFNAAAEGEPRCIEHDALRWITPDEIPQYEFCPADREILLRMRYEHAVRTVPCGRWRHFKGGSYEVLGIARNSETLEPEVVYRALYGDGGLWTRPAGMWNEAVEKDGRLCPRFCPEEKLNGDD